MYCAMIHEIQEHECGGTTVVIHSQLLKIQSIATQANTEFDD